MGKDSRSDTRLPTSEQVSKWHAIRLRFDFTHAVNAVLLTYVSIDTVGIRVFTTILSPAGRPCAKITCH